LSNLVENLLNACFTASPGLKERCKLLVFLALVLAIASVALSQGIDEGEFSEAMLAHKLRLLKSRFEQAEAELLMQTGAQSKVKKLELEDVFTRIKSLETEFQRGGYYPDLLDEQIFIIREKIRLILADPSRTPIDQEQS
jgi:hypothetical protein